MMIDLSLLLLTMDGICGSGSESIVNNPLTNTLMYGIIQIQRKREVITMKEYARYKFTTGWEADRIGAGYHEVTASRTLRTPSGLHEYITINGVSVKARHCEIIQVFAK